MSNRGLKDDAEPETDAGHILLLGAEPAECSSMILHSGQV